MDLLSGLDLFTGIGGITLALKEWVRPVAYCENDRYAQALLLSRMSMGELPVAPIWDDVKTLTREHLPQGIEIIYGGFPCQDLSIAGRGAGLAGERSGLFFEIVRLVGEIRPSFIFLENVPAIRSRGGAEVVGALAGIGYDCRWDVLSAYDVGAPFKEGSRWFLLAKAASGGRGQGDSERQRTREGAAPSEKRIGFADGDWWKTEPDVGRVAHGIPCRVDRLRGLGNSVVPAQAREAFKRLLGVI